MAFAAQSLYLALLIVVSDTVPALSPFAADLLADLRARPLLPPEQPAALAEAERAAPFSVSRELRTMLYLGATALSGGLGALLYQHHERLGPGLILTLMTALLVAAGTYAARHRPAFTWGIAPRTSVGADYALLLGCLLFLGIEGYAQAQLHVFGTRYGLATLLPALLFLPLAYRYDHRGVLALGLTALGAWLGVTVTPLGQAGSFDFMPSMYRSAAIGYGAALVAAAFHAEWTRHKSHFAPTYLSLGASLAGGGLASKMVDHLSFDHVVTGALPLAGLCYGLYMFAQRTRSYWFLVLAAGWAYFSLTYCFVWLADALNIEDGALLLIPLYFIASTIGFVRFFMNLKKLLPRS